MRGGGVERWTGKGRELREELGSRERERGRGRGMKEREEERKQEGEMARGKEGERKYRLGD